MLKKMSVLFCSIFVFSNLAFAQAADQTKTDQVQKDPAVTAQKDGGCGCGPDCVPAKDGSGMQNMKEQRAERKEKMEAMKKDYMEYQAKLNDLIAQYNKAKGPQQDAVKAQIRDLITAQTDKEIAAKKEMIAQQKERIDQFEKKTAEIEADKAKYIDDKVNFVTSKEGQEKMKKMNEKRQQMKEKKEKPAETPAASAASPAPAAAK